MNIYEFLAAFSLLGELGEEEDEDEKCIPDNPGGSVAVFCPLRLFLHTGHVSCCRTQGQMRLVSTKVFKYTRLVGHKPAVCLCRFAVHLLSTCFHRFAQCVKKNK